MTLLEKVKSKAQWRFIWALRGKKGKDTAWAKEKKWTDVDYKKLPKKAKSKGNKKRLKKYKPVLDKNKKLK